ncbi:LTA synthase family protein [Turicibacter sanguinis]|uniref:LTA synthase family protein n=1 Tax=Turicibacter sanguinis TaxID=154288 RepID=UPI001898D163|nr:LTA synthase family protein [Turicibacter sanguinis]
MQSLSFWLIFSILLTIVVETIKFKSIKKALYFMKHSPIEFILNVLIISSTLALSFMVTRKVFVFTIVTIFWLLLSITNTIVTTLRGYPLMFSDIFLIKEGLSLSSQYFTPLVISMVLILLGFLFWIGYDLFQIQFETTTLQYVMGTVYVFLAGYIFYKTEKKELPKPAEEVELYEQMGFAYSITDSLYPYLNRKPDSYSEEKMNNLAHDLMPYFKNHPQSEDHNVIMIQMESFFDPLTLQNLSINIDPIPTIRHLMKTEPFGKLIVPTFGGGTGKTEFEVLTSMNVDYFGPGEIPHNSILKSTDIESLATHFSQSGFETIAIHNYEGNFYNRHIAYQHLGFDRFVPLEYMAGIEVNHDLSQMNDEHLIHNIIKAISQFEKSFIYAISAGTHQPYNETSYDEHHDIQIEGDLSLEERASLQDYCIKLHRLDHQIKRLLKYLETRQTPTTLILFSDHLPNLPVINDETFYPFDHYEVPVMVKHPSEFTFHDQKLPAYQLATEILNAVGIRGGIMNAIHDLEKGTFHYQSDLKLAQYDLIYGKQLLASVFPQHKTEEIKFGIEPLTIHSIMKTDHHLVIKGSGFNGDSQVFIDGKRVPTTYISEGELHAEMKMNKGNLVTIKQISGYHQALDEGKSFELAKINS